MTSHLHAHPEGIVRKGEINLYHFEFEINFDIHLLRTLKNILHTVLQTQLMSYFLQVLLKM